MSYKPLVEISPNLAYNLGAVGGKDERIRFWGQKVKAQGHSKIRYGRKSTVGILKVTDSLSGDCIRVNASPSMIIQFLVLLQLKPTAVCSLRQKTHLYVYRTFSGTSSNLISVYQLGWD